MSPDEVRARVERDIANRSANRFGWDFRPFLLAVPEQRTYDGILLWTVLVERYGADGYHVIFDADREMFGLAYSGTCVGLYGGFMDAVDAM